MLRIGTLWRGGLVAATAVLLLGSGCASPDTRAGRDLADTVKIDGYRKLAETHKGETTLLYFVGPTGVDLHQAVTARNWSRRGYRGVEEGQQAVGCVATAKAPSPARPPRGSGVDAW